MTTTTTEAATSPRRRASFHPLTIREVRPLTDNAVEVTFAIPDELTDDFNYVSGQYVALRTELEGKEVRRSYSICAEPTPGELRIAIKRDVGGLFSNWANDNLQAGHVIDVMSPTGAFISQHAMTALNDPEAMAQESIDSGLSRYVAFAAGSGITPVLGMLRNHLADLPDVTHVHISPSASTALFATELQSYAARSPERPAYRLVERHDDTDGYTDLPRDLDALVPDWREREAWVCGPTGLLDSAESLWETAELTHQLHVERFRPTIIEGGEGGEITFLRTDVSVDADGTTPILDAGEEAGVLMPSGCRMGICFGCVVTMREGAVRDLRTGEVTIAEPGDDLPIQTCINAVAGTCDLDL